MFLAGAVAGVCAWWGIKASKRKKTTPLFLGQGNEGMLVSDIKLSPEEAALIITAARLFIEEMEEKYGPLYLPTDTEKAQADIAQDEDIAFEEALASTYE